MTAKELEQNVEKALKIGTANAESVIQICGAKKGILSWKQAQAKIKKGHIVKKIKV